MSNPQESVMDPKRDILAVRVMRMKKTGISEEEVNEDLRTLITNDNTVPEVSKMELFNSVLQEVGNLFDSVRSASSAMDTSETEDEDTPPSQPTPVTTPHNHDQEPPSWLAPLLLAIGQHQPRSSKKKFLDPDTFDGSQKKYPVFKQQLKAKFDAANFRILRKVEFHRLFDTIRFLSSVLFHISISISLHLLVVARSPSEFRCPSSFQFSLCDARTTR